MRDPCPLRESFISRVPVEILGKIFTFCLPEDKYITPDPMDAPLILCQVCSFWRALALSMSTLWSSIAIDASDSRPDIRLLNIWLDRSGSRPISFSIEQALETDPLACQRAFTDQASKALLRHLERWQNVEFLLWESTQDAFLHLPPTGTPLLESAAFSVNASAWETDFPLHFSNITYRSPLLRQYTWHAYSTELPMNIPWRQLTHLDLNSEASINDYLTILNQCHSLAILVLVLYVDGVEPDMMEPFPSDASVALGNLHTLDISSSDDMSPILDRLSVPSLLTLNVHQNSGSGGTLAALGALISRSSCPLQSLSYKDSLDTETEIVEFLKEHPLPYLSTLRMHVVPPLTKTILLLTASHDSNAPCLLPQLTLLDLGACVSSDGALARMVYSRWIPIDDDGHRCKRLGYLVVALVAGPDNHQEDLHILNELGNRGLTLDIHSYYPGLSHWC